MMIRLEINKKKAKKISFHGRDLPYDLRGDGDS